MTGVYSFLFCKYTNYSGIIVQCNNVDFKKKRFKEFLTRYDLKKNNVK